MGIGTSLVWIFLENPVPEMSQAVYEGLRSVVWDLGFALFEGRDPDFSGRGEKEWNCNYLFIYLLIRLPQKSGRAARIESHGAYYIQATHLQTKFRVI